MWKERNSLVRLPTECSTLMEWYRDPLNECSYYECDGAHKVRRLCAKGTSVPADYTDGSGANPCTKINKEDCGKDMIYRWREEMSALSQLFSLDKARVYKKISHPVVSTSV